MQVDAKTAVYGILGDPVRHSLSPLMHNAAFAALGLEATYLPFHVSPDNLPAAVTGIRALGIRGVNVTIPHKEAVYPLLDRVDGPAQLIGAVNTIVARDGMLIGYNTDAPGFLRSLTEDLRFSASGRHILLLGAGGACRAAAAALAGDGAAWVGIANRTPSRAASLVAELKSNFRGTTFAHFQLPLCDPRSVLPAVDLLVNTSSIGLQGEPFADLPWALLPADAAVYDMVYSAGGTSLTRLAQAHGLRSADGTGMLAAQGEEAFFLWTGIRPPAELMKSVVRNELARK